MPSKGLSLPGFETGHLRWPIVARSGVTHRLRWNHTLSQPGKMTVFFLLSFQLPYQRKRAASSGPPLRVETASGLT